MKNVPQNYSSADYLQFQFLHGGQAPAAGAVIEPVRGPVTVIAVHLHDGEDQYMRGLVDGTNAVCEAVRSQFGQLLIVNNTGDAPPSLMSLPGAAVVGDYELFQPPLLQVLEQQRRIVVTGWDARACVRETLRGVISLLPDAPSEVHFPLGALDDAKNDGISDPDEQKVVLSTLIGMYARLANDVRGLARVSYDGNYLAQHDDSGPPTALHFYSSVDSFGALNNAESPPRSS